MLRYTMLCYAILCALPSKQVTYSIDWSNLHRVNTKWPVIILIKKNWIFHTERKNKVLCSYIIRWRHLLSGSLLSWTATACVVPFWPDVRFHIPHPCLVAVCPWLPVFLCLFCPRPFLQYFPLNIWWCDQKYVILCFRIVFVIPARLGRLYSWHGQSSLCVIFSLVTTGMWLLSPIVLKHPLTGKWREVVSILNAAARDNGGGGNYGCSGAWRWRWWQSRRAMMASFTSRVSSRYACIGNWSLRVSEADGFSLYIAHLFS